MSTTWKNNPAQRAEIDGILEGRLPDIWDAINQGIVQSALPLLEQKGFKRIVLIVDELDKIAERTTRDGQSTNLEDLYLGEAGKLRAYSCDVIMTFPMELRYSDAATRLADRYGEIFELGLLPVRQRDGAPGTGVAEMRRIVERRLDTAQAGAIPDVFGRVEVLNRLICQSGGQLRQLFTFIRGAINRSDSLPLPSTAFDHTVRTQRRSFDLPVTADQRALLTEVHDSKRQSPEHPSWNSLVKNLRILRYGDATGDWFDVHPLMLEAMGFAPCP